MASYLSQSKPGSESKYVTLVSGDGYEFVLLREAVMISPAIKNATLPAITLPSRGAFLLGRTSTDTTSGIVLEKVCEYFQYWYRYREREDVPDMDIPVELCLELLVAADYLGLDKQNSGI
ncbi:Elongin-C like protein [Verticillium longisporum]|nr:Elongin-C like protein [Verticillium longisporum]